MRYLVLVVGGARGLFGGVPCTIWLAPSVVTVTGEVQVLIPEIESMQVNVTVTLELFQPLAFGAGLTVAVIFGGGGSVMDAEVVELPVTFRPSSTVSVTVKVPADEYPWVGPAPVPLVPSPKFQKEVSGYPSGSVDPLPLNEIT